VVRRGPVNVVAAAAAACPPGQQDERQLHSLMDALAVSEFLATFSVVCGSPCLTLNQLLSLDGPELFEIYSCLIKYLLAQWVSFPEQQRFGPVLRLAVAVCAGCTGRA